MRKRSDPRPFPNCCCFCRSYGSTISGQLCCSCGVELGRGPGRLDPAAAGTAGCGRGSVAAATLRGFGLWLGMGWPAAFRAAGRDGGGAAWVHLPDRLYSGRGRGGTEKSRLRPLDRPGGAGVEAGPKPLPGILWRIAHELARTGWNVRAAIHVARTRRSQHAGDRRHEGTETLFLLARSRQYRTSPPGCSTSPRPMCGSSARRRTGGGPGRSPSKIPRHCLVLAGIQSGEVVLDPFVGTGTTLGV